VVAEERTGRRLVLLRHGRTAWNEIGRAQGHEDIELDQLGHEQAAAVAPYIAALQPAALWSSDLSRARQTAEYLEQVTGLAAKLDERLRELDVGARQGMTAAEFQDAFPAAFAGWAAGDDMARVPGSEVVSEVAARILPALRESLGALAPGETGVVVTHGACLKVGLVGMLGWPLSHVTGLRGMNNCRWAVLAQDDAGGRLRLEGYDRGADGPPGGSVDL
jgi:broad specificity phosphatase PhoE